MLEPSAATPALAALAEAQAQVRRYHQRTKHQLNAYARGPETLDWDAQPSPWRRWPGADVLPLPLAGTRAGLAEPAVPWQAWAAPREAQPFNLASLGLFFELSLALAAWKQAGPDRWAVRINPSSGNLHPTEGWLWLDGLGTAAAGGAADGLSDGLYHYAPLEHALERRAAFAPLAGGEPVASGAKAARAWIGLSSIHWREAWKYGERAFRYCQLDAGHATGALRVAAALLGWRLLPVPLPVPTLARVLGLDRDGDFGPAEREDAECLFELVGWQESIDFPSPRPSPTRGEGGKPAPSMPSKPLSPRGRGAGERALPPERPTTWFGQPNRLDRHPMYRWPVIAEVAQASALGEPAGGAAPANTPDNAPASTPASTPGSPTPAALHAAANHSAAASTPSAAQLVRQRRSAQRFDARARMPAAQLWPLLAALSPERAPFDAAPGAPGVHVLLFAHRVDGLAPGVYLLPRGPQGLAALRAALPPALNWASVAQAPAELGLLELAQNPALAGTLRTLNCHQALGSDAILGFALLAQWSDWQGPSGQPAPSAYRQRLQEAGLIGQVLYLEAEAAGLAGTGIGCFFDDGLHQLIGLDQGPHGTDAQAGAALQSVYHFTIGQRVTDGRIATESAYAHLPPERHA